MLLLLDHDGSFAVRDKYSTFGSFLRLCLSPIDDLEKQSAEEVFADSSLLLLVATSYWACPIKIL